MIENILIIIGVVLIFMGAAFSLIALCLKKHNEKLYLVCKEKTVGIFNRIHEQLNVGTSDRKCFFQVYKYVVNDEEFYYKGNKGSGRKECVDTGNVVIYYNPEKPEEAYSDRRSQDVVVKVLGLVGIFLLINGVALILVGVKIS